MNFHTGPAAMIAQEIRFAFRVLGKSRGFTLTSIAVLALAIGANTAMFSVSKAILFPLPYPSVDRLMMLWTENPAQNLRQGRSAFWNVEQWRKQSKSFVDMAAFDPVSTLVNTVDASERILVVRATPNLFSVLGVQPSMGRLFTAEEAEARERVVILSDRYWQSRFGSSPDAIGATLDVDGVTSRVIGVVPEAAGSNADLWQPHTAFADWETLRVARGAGAWLVVGRLQPGVSAERAQEEMSAIARNLDEQLPAAQQNRGISLMPFSLYLTGERTLLALSLLTGAVFCVLLIAASNVSSLSLARAAARERDIATRAALGASRLRIAGHLLTESLTLAFISGVVGVGVAVVAIRLIVTVMPAGLARTDVIALDASVLGWVAALCLLAGILVGLAPVVLARRDLRLSAIEASRGISIGVAGRGVRRGLVVSQFALSIVLLFGAGLLLRSLWSIQDIDPGFNSDQVLTIQLAIPAERSEEQRINLYGRILEQTTSLPGVKSAGIIGDFFIGNPQEQIVTIEASDRTQTGRLPLRRDEIAGNLFETVGVPLIRGRSFSAEDGPNSQRVAIVNEAMAQRLWPGIDPVGKRFKLGPVDAQAPWFTIVGIAPDMRRQGRESEPTPQMFEPLTQNSSRLATLLVRTSNDDPLTTATTVQTGVRQLDKYAAAYGPNTLENRLSGFLAQRRFQSSLLAWFAAAALLMAAVGIYGLLQYSISARTREIGIRMAVGAGRNAIFRMILREGLTVGVVGAGLGLLASLWLARAGSSLLFGVRPADPGTIVAVTVLLLAVSAAACYFPARRAMRVQPIAALRQE